MGAIEQETAIDRVEVAILGLDDGQTLDGLCLYPASVGDIRKLLAVAKALRAEPDVVQFGSEALTDAVRALEDEG